ncbi:peroxisomal biogenesis factor 11 [Fusarium mundagurra]|uniref:Peroxisomal biogenesis factor 11 n=1 Tax=Fusarium mundagurra TaxID=1567541 RepID=A0A8H5XVM9_9HYPO|nr:peroxisomal biogenesis factor 11 [Fusarium mundagurra]
MIKNATTIAANFSHLRFTTTERDVLLKLLIFSSRTTAWVLGRNDAPIASIQRAVAAFDETTSTNGKDSPGRQIHPEVQLRRRWCTDAEEAPGLFFSIRHGHSTAADSGIPDV